MHHQLIVLAIVMLSYEALEAKTTFWRHHAARESVVFPLQPESECPSDHVKCPSGRCIPSRWRCDGDNDCGDEWDEPDTCPPVSCSESQRKCPTKNRCRPISDFCNGVNDCGDNSDEPEDCKTRTCGEGELRCSSGQCISKDYYCNGYTGCSDGTLITDANCPHITCGPGLFKCPHLSKCIPARFVCDGDNDCKDNSDEPHNCRERQCQSDEFRCNSGQCLNRTAICLMIVPGFCRDMTDVSHICDDYTCPHGWTKCVSDGKCVQNTNLCDGVQQCVDGSDESNQHCEMPIECAPDTARCPRARRCINTRYFCDTDNDCGDNSDEEESFCSLRTCQPNEVRCNNGQCLNKEAFCTGSYLCRDGSLTVNSNVCEGSVQCSPGNAQCRNSFRCISTRYFCDMDNDCGDNSDEEESFCSSRTCQPGEVRCNNGQCLDEEGFCSGRYGCRDGSLTTSSELCSGSQLTCMAALSQIRVKCGEHPFTNEFENMNPQAIYHKVVEMDLQTLCRPPLQWFECIENAASTCTNVDNPMVAEMKQTIAIGRIALNYVCVQEIEVIDRHKACLLKETDGERDSPIPTLAIVENLQRSCFAHMASMRPGPPCLPRDFQACIKHVVAGQCGDEIATVLDGLADRVHQAVGCPQSRVRSATTYKKRRDYQFYKSMLKSFF